MKSATGSVGSALLLVALTAPWQVPPQGGPSPAVQTWLFSLACTGLLLGMLPLTASKRLFPGWGSLAAATWLLAALIGSAIGLSQYFGVEQYFVPWMSPAAGLGEAYANLRQRNQFATLTNIGLAALLWWAVQPGVREPQRVMTRAGVLAAAVLLAVGNAASSSRTGMVQLVLFWGLVWFWGGLRQHGTKRVLTVALMAYVGATLALPVLLGVSPAEHGLWGRLRPEDSGCTSRLTLWSNVLHLISLHPWLGWGWGELDYAHFMTLYDSPRFCEILDNAHNLPLHLAVELGIPVALLICAGVIWWIVRAQAWRETNPTRQLAWSVLAVILLHSMLEYPLWYGPFQIAIGLCIGLLWPAQAKTSEMRARWHAWSAWFGGSLVVVAAYGAWDYHRISQIYKNPDQRSSAYRDNTLDKVKDSWLFRDQVRFAAFTLTPLTHENALQVNAQAHELLHYSPEARVVEKVIESAVMLGRDEEALLFLARYQAAYPQQHAQWVKQQLR